MKKLLIVLSVALLALTATTPVFAKDGNKNEGNSLRLRINSSLVKGLNLGKLKNLDVSKFVLVGTVVSAGTDSLTVSVSDSVHVGNIVNGQVTIAVNADTRFWNGKEKHHDDDEEDGNNNALTTVMLASLKPGDRLAAAGTVNGTVLTASNVRVFADRKASKAFGLVTAKTDNSITIKNNVTGVSQTLTTDGDTKVHINGETKTAADVQVGDRGFVKFKTVLTNLVAKAINLFR